MDRLKDKVALVTGGSRGIGAAVAKRLAREGATVAITYTSSGDSANAVVAAIEADHGRAMAIHADSADIDAVRAAVAATVERFQRLDVLVNNAGIAKLGTITDYSLEDLDRMIAVNVKGLFVATQEAVRHMEEGGRVINIGSISSEFMPIAGGSVYAMTKAAVAGLTRGLARDLGPRGITVNNVQPGRVDTEMTRSSRESAGDDLASDKVLQMIAVHRYGTCDEVAGLIAYLAGPEAAFVTGANLRIDGGTSA
ncbi:3-oxoacyl-ACP reductase FabG [Mycobacterium sp. KBS0706]|jgi:3-oxoacyl-[acyl-carrier protein] reductase|uniref:3-oxoacyl-ACP reductase family protein n=1 Tax=Mycobacterium sp. KBS0706 TaxID=2578109 RepID=UPI00110F9023|nr:3-oxoacyl-ACP reductase family protein [Mycobacterium sp. KBS0706]TSD86111.1 3-oxoacyl-ACP reductase FabG [Mycobacterium sp. KBS0706]